MRNKASNQFKKELSHKFDYTYRGLVCALDTALIDANMQDSTKLVYAGLYAAIPKKERLNNITSGIEHKYYGRKSKVIKDLGIAESTYYMAINELEEKKWITTGYNQHKNGSNSTAYYLLHQTIDLNEEGRVLMTSEMLKRQYVRTKQKSKTLSANSKIILALLAQESRKSFKREISTTASEISKDHNIPLSTIYYLITKFVNCSALTRNKEQDKLVFVLLAEYIKLKLTNYLQGLIQKRQSLK